MKLILFLAVQLITCNSDFNLENELLMNSEDLISIDTNFDLKLE